MKKIIVLFCFLFLIGGCSFIDIENESIDNIVDNILSSNNNVYNEVLNGYKFYLPRGLKLIKKNDNNNVIYRDDTYFYMYVDMISYYYKVPNSYVEDKSVYYSKKLNYGNGGYIQITKVEDKYFVEYVYNYSKIEAYIGEENLKPTIMNMTYILSTIKYNDKIISTLIDEGNLNYKEEKYDIFSSKKGENEFLQYIEKYDNYEGNKNKSKDNDSIEYSINE